MPASSTSVPLPTRAGAPHRVGWSALGLVAATVLAYANSLHGPLFFDDTASIVQNESIRQLWPVGKVLFAPDVAGTAGRPLLNLSFALNYAVGGLSPVGYHVVNTLIHAAAALALFGLVRRVLLLPRWGGRLVRDADGIAGVAALLWAVHPLQTESVTYVSQRAESLVGLFYLLTWYTFVRAAEPGAKPRWAVLSVAALFAGVLTKEIVATAPVVIALFDRVFLSASWSEVWRRRRGLYLGYIVAWIALGGLMVGSGLFSRGVGFGERIGWLDYAKTECEALSLYLKLSFWPHPLVIDYGQTPARGGLHLALGAIAVIGWGAAVAFAWRPYRPLAFAGLAALLMLAPTSSVIPVAFQPIAEHRMYLPLAMLLVAVVVAAYAVWGRRALIAGLVLGCAGVVLTLARNRDYASEETLWRDTIAKRPDNWRAYNALANVLYKKKRLTEGIALVETALRLNPTEAKLQNNYANALAVVGRLPEALVAGAKAVELDPRYPDARASYGQALLKAGRVAEAVAQFEAARQLKPESAEIRSNLCDALRQAGRAVDAVTEGETALRLQPDFAVAHCNLGLALVDLGRTDEAIAHYQAALRLKPDYLEVLNNLGVTLMNTGRLPEAQAQLEEAIRQKPDYVEAHNSLGIVLAKLGRLDDAGREFETALRLQPGHVQARDNLKILQGMRENPQR